METSSAVLDSRSDQTLRLNRSIHPVVASEDSLDERPNSIRWRPVATYNVRTTATLYKCGYTSVHCVQNQQRLVEFGLVRRECTASLGGRGDTRAHFVGFFYNKM